jgi:hypothetical protein
LRLDQRGLLFGNINDVHKHVVAEGFNLIH